jgi:hypothetical protein
MARPSPYTDAQKASILEAVKTSRKDGSWADALKAAKEAGFKGGVQYLMKFASGGKKPGKPKGGKARGKLGRPKGSKNKSVAAKPLTSGIGVSLREQIRQIVREEVRTALAEAFQ